MHACILASNSVYWGSTVIEGGLMSYFIGLKFFLFIPSINIYQWKSKIYVLYIIP